MATYAPLATVFVGSCVAATLACERLGWRRGVWIAKPSASFGFLLAALLAGAWQSAYGRAVFAGLVLSFLGDVCLIPRNAASRTFLAGVTAFLLAHVAFTVAFACRGFEARAALIAAVVAAIAVRVAWDWLGPHLRGHMRVAAPVYMVVISAMVVSAIASHLRAPNTLMIAGALAFYGSDLAVARERFVVSTFLNRLWGLPLYYAAQLCLALSVGPS